MFEKYVEREKTIDEMNELVKKPGGTRKSESYRRNEPWWMKNLELICGTRVERHQGEDYKEVKSQRKFSSAESVSLVLQVTEEEKCCEI